MQLLPLEFGKKLVESLLGGDAEDETAAVAEMVRPMNSNTTSAYHNKSTQQSYEQSAPTQGMQQPAYDAAISNNHAPQQQANADTATASRMFNRHSLQVLKAHL